jgi:hypothetical protein
MPLPSCACVALAELLIGPDGGLEESIKKATSGGGRGGWEIFTPWGGGGLFFAFGDVAEDEALQLAVVVFGVGFPEVVEEGFKVLIGF